MAATPTPQPIDPSAPNPGPAGNFLPEDADNRRLLAIIEHAPFGAHSYELQEDGRLVLDLAGEARAGMTVETLLAKFRSSLNNDRMLLPGNGAV